MSETKVKPRQIDWTQVLAERVTLAPTPAYDLAATVLGVTLNVDTGSTLTVPTGKQYDHIYSAQTFSVGAASGGSGGRSALMNFNLVSAATSNAASTLYGVIGAVTTNGAGGAKAIYGRGVQATGSTGVAMGLVGGVVTAAGGGDAVSLQLTNDTDTGKKAYAFVWGTSNTGSNTLTDYGLLFDGKVNVSEAVLQANAVGAGDFLRLKNAGASADLFRVNAAGKLFSTGGNVASLATYADNAAAAAGGLVAGDLYRTATGQVQVRY